MTNECGWTLQAAFSRERLFVARRKDARQVCDSGNLGWEGEVREQQMKFKASPSFGSRKQTTSGFALVRIEFRSPAQCKCSCWCKEWFSRNETDEMHGSSRGRETERRHAHGHPVGLTCFVVIVVVQSAMSTCTQSRVIEAQDPESGKASCVHTQLCCRPRTR